MIQLILCGLVTGLLYFWNYKYCKLSADPGIISWIPWVCLNGMLLYLIMKSL